VNVKKLQGVRTKLAVDSTQEGVDPVGACVGQRGVRVQEVIREVNNEKIDIIPYTKDIREFMRAALAPADGLQVEIDEQNRKAVVTAPDDQLSLCIGRGGQNVRLAAKLTGYHITVKSQSGTVQSTVTGQEEYEIDTFEGLDAEVRTFLIQHKLTTSADLARFTNRWQLAEEVSDAQKAILQAKVDIFEKEMAERDRIRELKTKQEAAAAAATEATPAEA
jgi:transcription antitermination factor NusA-like protein